MWFHPLLHHGFWEYEVVSGIKINHGQNSPVKERSGHDHSEYTL
jgi:hypothetical protein